MNIEKPKKEKMSKKAIILYVSALVICIIAGIIIYFVQRYGDGKSSLLPFIDPVISENKEDEEKAAKKEQFEEIFTNDFKTDDSKYANIVYTYYENQEALENNYNLDINIPYINIKNDTIAKYNKEISETFINKADDVLKTMNRNIIYTVQYAAIIENDILSVIIKSNLKEGANPQRLIILTYNYDLKNKKEVTLQETIQRKGLKESDIQSEIYNEIKEQQNKVDDLKELGYSIFERNLNSDMYNISNTKEFFVKDGTIYIIYAYGNDALTSEMDLIII